ncbi:hypothetical protein EIP86_008200 [Pleurotus ostreatoroseus]|nr:hypothetical protein EIP86_008200 [Pleurotus ostreatoroseus]
MFARLAAFSFALAVILAVTVEARTGHYARSPSHDVFSAATLGKRTLTGQTIAFSCYGGGGDCECPTDNNGDSGVLINVYPGFQCAYPNGACTWDDESGALQNIYQTNCPSTAPCSKTSGCICPKDNNDDTGVMINQFTGYQCAYHGGACTWDGGEFAKYRSDELPHVLQVQTVRTGQLIFELNGEGRGDYSSLQTYHAAVWSMSIVEWTT